MSFLKPKWQNSDSTIRNAEVENITQNETLVKITKKCKYPDTIQQAEKKLVNFLIREGDIYEEMIEWMTMKISKKDYTSFENVQLIFTAIEDQDILFKIAKEAKSTYIKHEAVKRITNPTRQFQAYAITPWPDKYILEFSPDIIIPYLKKSNKQKCIAARLALGITLDSIVLHCPSCGALFHSNDLNLKAQWEMIKNGTELVGGMIIHCPSCEKTERINSYYETSAKLNNHFPL